MSRPQGHARVTTGPKPPTASPAVASTRRSAGTLPGIARTASTLRQKTPGPSSLPAHLRNTSAPRVPSPLGQGTPARPTKHILPVRTSKTTEKHVLLPEDPQLAPLPRSASETSLARARSTSVSAPSRSDERSEAEKMTKRERNEAGFSRLIAYDTAEGYRLKLLQAFLRREHGVGVVRVFDDCVYAVYNLPLLPGYGATNRVRSSPAVKSPGGVSMMERMTQAEEQGYDDEYFPVEADEPVTGADPSEYILSRSPPSPVVEHSLALGDERAGPIDLPEPARSPPKAEPVMVYEEPETPTIRPPPRMRRRSSGYKHPVAEAVFFNYGVSVFFGFAPGEETSIMEDIRNAGVWQVPSAEDDWEVEEFHYEYEPDAESPRIYNDMFTFKSRSHLFKLSLAHAIAQSTKLSVYEAKLQNSLEMTSLFPKELATTGHLNLDRKEALQMTGRLFKLRMDVNLIGGVLDTPDIFWSDASLYPLYEAINQYLEIEPRVQVLNDRLSVVGDLLDIIHDYIAQRANHRITWIIILLIAVAIIVGVGEVVARLVFHAILRDKDDMRVLGASRYLLRINRK
ncbi:hypothetical protein CcaverHIS002_0409440 [Cutaneotrichosporon cavernicola]|uniref:DUF155 domain-containing protein n=1 Tax=Cutaneotrichosporon cavernicola TaxID=279322 RepID=A0AA48QWG0_9TREE|nr:uncharacterized protein CcaverHIS019_0409370 [Cutaneotrichosporon cavernicola]BEI84340.1 hypothetical protein CcaverHIS002_0409440 [Cutaneotrichosporon cavernicola]BEI92117.1 hypothetical protein CcaverHIS019_0409370 [Cutaneotrichosporon cavernicola]BEI99887.1 hypothetical protein CcaverHIS631_0409300 [Cutaneotrichosporon cavernicola]BEJ07662.1 hypothetical protein CcaverHIS641_0409310 [Cutaneotrichosporon cavernicola]